MQYRFEALDGMRGGAALAVFVSHIQTLRHQGGWLSQGGLAVDFLFLLSGFVIGAAYEKRLDSGLSLISYGRIRLARLYPMIGDVPIAVELRRVDVAGVNVTRPS
jgi:peptidoglycan/LPS O-acetylase OafA/YrhL